MEEEPVKYDALAVHFREELDKRKAVWKITEHLKLPKCMYPIIIYQYDWEVGIPTKTPGRSDWWNIRIFDGSARVSHAFRTEKDFISSEIHDILEHITKMELELKS
jgi:hypothetical protein